MKKKIAILGSTGSIGNTLLKIINQNKKNFEIKLLTANVNYKRLLKQANQFKVKNLSSFFSKNEINYICSCKSKTIRSK